MLLFIAVTAFTGCASYTVKNDMTVDVKAGNTAIPAGQCKELSDDLFGLFSDYPIPITQKDGSALVEGGEKEKTYNAAHYVVRANGSVVQAEEGCKPKTETETKTKE